MPDAGDQFEDKELQAPKSLASAFKSLPREEIFVPRSVDQGVLVEARKQLGGSRRRGLSWFDWNLWPVAAAVVFALFVCSVVVRNRPRSGSSRPGFAAEDVNHDGRVDILDAFILAKDLKAGHALDLRLDLNGDGVVDDKDVAIIAARAVKLDKGGRS